MKMLLLIAVSLLAGCSGLPKEIEDPPAFDLSYAEASVNSSKYKNVPVRWGGTIVEVENEANFSALQVLYYPLGSFGRPKIDETHQGRFVIKTTEFLDPAVYTKNSSITVAGILEGDTERKIGNKTLRFPLIKPSHIHLWPEYDYAPYYGGYGGFGYGGWGYYPYGGFYGYYPNYWGGYYRPFVYRRWR